MILDVFDHLGIVVRSNSRLVLSTVRHRNPPDKIRHPRKRSLLLAWVFVQVMIDVPRLVTNDEIVVLLANHVVQHHEVINQDLVHPADRLECMQIVLATLTFDVRGFVRERRTCRMDALATRLQHFRDGMLREPVDCNTRHKRAQFGGDCCVTLRVPKSDGDEIKSACLRRRARGRGGRSPSASRIARLTRTGYRACGMCPTPSSATNSPCVRSASARPDRCGAMRSASPCSTNTGQRTDCASCCASASVRRGEMAVAASVSGVVSSAQPTLSSNCLVECASGNACAKKNSTKSR